MKWVWLAIGVALMVFVPAQSSLWLAAWLAPVFLLRFARTQSARFAFPALGLGISGAMIVAFRDGFMPLEGAEFVFAVGGIALAYVAVFAIDRVLWQRVPRVASTLVFPAASTTIGFLSTLGNPVGTAGSEAYSQTSGSLQQLASVTGIWGIVFLMAWFASVINLLWEGGFDSDIRLRTISAFVAVLVVVLSWGSARTSFSSPPDETVRVATITPDPALTSRTLGLDLDSSAERSAARGRLQPLVDDLFSRSAREATSGSRIIAWSEGSARVLKEDESAFIDRAKQFAQKHAVYLEVGLASLIDPHQKPKVENRAVLITPQGSVGWDYHKANPTPGDPELPGDGEVPTLETPYGTLGTIICQDDLFPAMTRQAQRRGVDILLVPSNDWQAVAAMHASVSAFRSVESGLSIVRPTSQGVSLATDPLGRTISWAMTDSDSSQRSMVANVPIEGGSATAHRWVGDGFAYLCIAALVASAMLAVVRRLRHPRAEIDA